MIPRLLRILAVAAVVALGTWLAGWWAVPLCGAVYALLRARQEGAVREAAIGAMIAWTALLIWQVSHPAFARLSSAVSGVFPVPGVVLMLVAVCIAGLLAGSAAHLTHRPPSGDASGRRAA